MNTIMAKVLKVLFPHGLSLSYILIHSIIFQNGLTNVSNSSKGVSILCHLPPFTPRQGLGRDIAVVSERGLGGSSIEYRIEKHVSSNMLA